MFRSRGLNRGGRGKSGGGGSREFSQSSTNIQNIIQMNPANSDGLGNFKIVSFNVRGLNSPYKRSKVLNFLHRKKIDIALIQETHLKPDDVSRVQNYYYKPIVASTDGSRTKGVMILMRRSINLTIERSGSENNGRLAFCCTSIQGKKVAFISLYAPTIFDADFFAFAASELLKLSDYHLYTGLDANAVVSRDLDRSSHTLSSTQEAASNALNCFIKDLNFADVCRGHNLLARDYTFFSARHKTFSRIDYILVSAGLSCSVHSVSLTGLLHSYLT